MSSVPAAPHPPNHGFDQKYLELLRHALTGAIYDESSWRELKPTTAWRRWVINFLGKYQLKVMRAFEYDFQKRQCGEDWPGIAYTMVGLKRLENIETLVRAVYRDAIPGDILEAGVWRGGAAIYAQAIQRVLGETRTLWLADSFEGLPPPKLSQDVGWDMSNVEYLKVGAASVRANFERFNLWGDNIRFLEGWFSETLPTAPVKQLALLRLDSDLYQSTMETLRPLYDKVSVGGFVIVDDYHTWEPCRCAIHDFVEERKIAFDPVEIDASSIYWRKRQI